MTANTKTWSWYASADAEIYTVGPLPTHDAVIAEAKAQQLGAFATEDGVPALDFYVVEACCPPLRLADWIGLDNLRGAAEEALTDSDWINGDCDSGPFFTCTKEDEQDLKVRIAAACDAWQAERGLVFKVNSFSDTRNEAHITIAVETAEVQP